jgi:diaminopimelate decarboxylase
MDTVDKYFARSGRFWIDGLDLEGLVARHPTPCYVYSASVIREKYDILKEHFPGFDIFFSFKANPNLAIAKMLLGLGAGADVSSLGELKGAFKVGFKPGNILFVGPAKTEEEIRYAIANDIAAVVAESPYELALIDELAGKLNKQARVMLRINTLEKPTAPEIMVGGPSKFGIDEEVVVEAVRGVALKHSTIVGIHAYAASQVLDPEFIGRHISYVADLALRLAKAIDFDLQCIDFGGGFGVPYKEADPELDVARIAEDADLARGRVLDAYPGCRLAFEVGRYVIAEAGVFLTRAVRIKTSRGKHFVLTDAGMNHFSRPVFQRLNHPVRLVNKITAEPVGEFDVGGPICTPLDVSGKAVRLPAPALGDVVGFFNAGAYGYSMSMINFMSLGWPAEVMVDDGRAFVIRKPRLAEDFFDEQPLK